LLTSFF